MSAREEGGVFQTLRALSASGSDRSADSNELDGFCHEGLCRLSGKIFWSTRSLLTFIVRPSRGSCTKSSRVMNARR